MNPIILQSYAKKWVSFLCFLIIALQNPIWPLWGWGGYVAFISIVIVALLLSSRKRKHESNSYYISVLLLFLVFIIIQQIREFTPSSYLYFVTYLFVLKIHENEKAEILQYLTIYLSIIVAISLPLWFVHVYITNIPMYGILDLSSVKGGKPGLFYVENYLFFVDLPSSSFPRFWSMFNEPGALGTIGAFVLYANDYNYKDKKNLIIFIGCIFTFSLAFYVLTSVGIVSKSIKGSFLKTLISFAFVFFIFWLIDFSLKENDTYKYVIVARVEEGLDNSLEARASERTNSFFEKFVFSQDAVFGIGTEGAKAKGLLTQGNSYRHFIIKFGWISVLAIFLAYWSLTFPRNKKMLTFYIIILLSFLQRSQTWVAWELILYVCASLPEKDKGSQFCKYSLASKAKK